MQNIESKVESLIEAKIKSLGYELYDVQYIKEGKDYFLRVFIDKPDGIDLNDCEKVNDGINDILDEADYIKEQYFLEVSSPGIERILRKDKHLEANIGKEVEIKLFKPIDKQKEYIGILKQFDEETLIIEVQDGKEVNLERKNISLIKLKYNWE